MLTIIVPGIELYDEKLQVFTTSEVTELQLEHSLVSLSKWESIYEKPFLSSNDKTTKEVLDYVEAMVLNDRVTPEVFSRLSQNNLEQIHKHIDAKMSATWFNEQQAAPRSREVITSELIYYWMLMFNIPFACETWHLNRLFTLIKICNLKNAKPTKMSRSDQIARNRELNAQRRAQLGSRG